MANNFTTVASEATAPLATKVATLELDDTFQAGVSAIVDASGARAKTLAISATGAAKVDGSAVTQPVSGPLTDAQLRATAVPVSGTVATGGLTDAQLRATAVPVSGTVATGGLTDTQLRATAVPVSGTVTASGPLTDTQLRATAVPVSGTVTTTPPANASTNVAQVAGTAADTNSGVKSAGTLRVVLATDQPALTNKLLVTPDSVALPANQSVNVAQINGVTPLMGAGNTGTGSPRVTIATDQAAVPVSLASVPSHAVTNAGTFAVQNTPAVAAAATLTNVASSATNVTVLASNASRKQATVYNDSTQILYLKFGATASATSHTIQMVAASYYELPQPVYTGILDGLWASANGNARVTELT